MKSIPRHALLIASALLLGTLAHAARGEVSADGLWADAVPAAALAQPRTSGALAFRTLALDTARLRALLAGALPERAGGAAADPRAIVTLPLPEGGFARFAVERTAVMAPALAARYPEIQAFRGVGLDEPHATARLDVSPRGFHAHVLSPRGAIYVDPDTGPARDRYVSYYSRDFRSSKGPWSCGVSDENEFGEAAALASLGAPLASGAELRSYRLAVATTGEYTQFHGGSVAGALAAVVTTINRVNNIYERELAIRMQLVANNDQIIFVNPLSDPYDNFESGLMLGQNQATIDAIIGDASYDIGHVFGTGGGGVAALASVCRSLNKARGVTGSAAPVGDPFDVDFVAHEIGHQFAATHTFNGTTGSCGGQRAAPTAYEPGSGSTIMAYAGICGAENLQLNSDAHFHGASYDQIISYTTVGTGNSCAAVSATGNAPPLVDAGDSHTIPIGTPFVLTGSALDPDGDPLTFAWEQFDLGAQSPPQTDDGSRPLFRAFLPVDTPSRTFPRWSDILSGSQTIGERLPTTDRTLTFRLSAFDNRLGGGGVDSDEVTLAVSAGAGPFAVTAPNTPYIDWTPGATVPVTWNVAGTDQPPVSCPQVDILLSTDGGTSFTTLLAAEVANDGAENVIAPSIVTAEARVALMCSSNVFFDVSNANFSIGIPFHPADVDRNRCVDRTDALIVYYGIILGWQSPLLDVNRNGLLGFGDVVAVILAYTNPGGTPCL